MRLVWGLVAVLGLLVGAGLAYERFTPPEQVTRPAAPHAAILTGEPAQPVLAAEPAPPTPTRRPPAAPARSVPSVNPSGPVAPPPAGAVSNTADERPLQAARDLQPAAPARAEAPPVVATGVRLDGARPAATAAGGAQRDVAWPTPEPPKPGVPRVSAATPTPCVPEPPPRHLDAAAPAPGK